MNFFRRCCESKRECLTYVIILIWVGIGILGTYYDTNFNELAAYFILQLEILIPVWQSYPQD